MNNTNSVLQKVDGYCSEENLAVIETFLKEVPIIVHKKVNFEAFARIYCQDIYVGEKRTGTIPFYVLFLTPSESIRRVDINFTRRVKLQGLVRIFSQKCEFKAGLNFISGSFFVRLYKIPSRNKVNLETPDSFKKIIYDRSRDSL